MNRLKVFGSYRILVLPYFFDSNTKKSKQKIELNELSDFIVEAYPECA